MTDEQVKAAAREFLSQLAGHIVLTVGERELNAMRAALDAVQAKQLGDPDPLRTARKMVDEIREKWMQEAARANKAEAALAEIKLRGRRWGNDHH